MRTAVLYRMAPSRSPLERAHKAALFPSSLKYMFGQVFPSHIYGLTCSLLTRVS